jgi:hypothetical protein
MELLSHLQMKFKIIFKALPYVVVFVVVKIVLHFVWGEFIILDGLMTAIISTNIFLIGFIFSGILTDYKEAEKLPVEIVASIEAINDEYFLIHKTHSDIEVIRAKSNLVEFVDALLKWLYKKKHLNDVLKKIQYLNIDFHHFTENLPPSVISRIKFEKDALRKNIIRIQSIRETSFASSVYTVVGIASYFIIFLLLFLKIDRIDQSLIYVGFFAFILTYIIFLIQDLDNPFDYYDKNQGPDEVSLYPIYEMQKRIISEINEINNK